jgi:hypothetical protein
MNVEVRCFRHSVLPDSFCVFLIGNDRFVDGNINAFLSDLDWRQPKGSNTLGKMEEYKQEKDEHLVAISSGLF